MKKRRNPDSLLIGSSITLKQSFVICLPPIEFSGGPVLVNPYLCGPYETRGEAKKVQGILSRVGIQARLKELCDCD